MPDRARAGSRSRRCTGEPAMRQLPCATDGPSRARSSAATDELDDRRASVGLRREALVASASPGGSPRRSSRIGSIIDSVRYASSTTHAARRRRAPTARRRGRPTSARCAACRRACGSAGSRARAATARRRRCGRRPWHAALAAVLRPIGPRAASSQRAKSSGGSATTWPRISEWRCRSTACTAGRTCPGRIAWNHAVVAAAGHDVLLDAELGHVEAVDHVARRHDRA